MLATSTSCEAVTFMPWWQSRPFLDRDAVLHVHTSVGRGGGAARRCVIRADPGRGGCDGGDALFTSSPRLPRWLRGQCSPSTGPPPSEGIPSASSPCLETLQTDRQGMYPPPLWGPPREVSPLPPPTHTPVVMLALVQKLER